jgi:GAF domain-containing protein
VSPRPKSPLAGLAQLAADMGPALVPAGNEELLRSITESARQIFDAAACSLALVNEQEDELHFIMASGLGADAVIGMRMPAGQGVAGWVLMSGQAIAIDEVRKDPRFAASVAVDTGYVPQTILAMPLETDRGTIGVIEVLDRHWHGDSGTRDMALLSVFARQAALAIESSRVFADLGRALFAAAAKAAAGEELGAALREQAAIAPPPRADLARLAAMFHELGQAGAGERRLVVSVVDEVLAYLRARPAR